MEFYAILLLSVVTMSSLILNTYLIMKVKSLKRAKVVTYDVKEVLHDLLSGSALVRVSRIAPEDVFFKSMRDK